VFDGHYPILVVPRHIGMASIKNIQHEYLNQTNFQL